MNKRYKLLLLLLCAGIVTSAFPSSGTGATSESIAFYNSKKSILEMKNYDEAYDTNHDGIVNVFDVIRKNKEVFQEESYTDLKSKIYSLETQIEILTQKLAEKEDKSQSESDISEIYTALSGKVDQQNGKQLSSNDYTDEEKQKLENLSNYDDTSVKSDITEISSVLSEKVDNQEGKQLSSNDFTDADKEKLEIMNNYDDSEIKSEITDINSELSSIKESLSGKADHEEGKKLSSNDYTDEEKKKLESLSNYDDTQIRKELHTQNQLIDSLVDIANDEKNKYDNMISNIENDKVNKEDGKQLSSNDYTDEEKQKLEGLINYDDTNIRNELNDIIEDINSYKEENKIYKTCYVSESGNDNSNGSELTPYKTIQHAIDQGYKEIVVSAGNYAENVSIINKSDITIRKNDFGNEKIVIQKLDIISSENIHIYDTHATPSDDYSYCYTVDDSENVTMERCIASDNAKDGFVINNSNGKFICCKAYNIGNSIYYNSDGFNIHGIGYTEFIDCTAYDCYDDGISHHDGCTGRIDGGEFYNCTHGGGIAPAGTVKININNVYVHDCFRGLELTGTENGTYVSNSVFTGNTTDIYCNSTNTKSYNTKYETSDLVESAFISL